MTLAQRIATMPDIRPRIRKEEEMSLRTSPFTLVDEIEPEVNEESRKEGGSVSASRLTQEESEHLAFCERHDFKAHEKEVVECITAFRKMKKDGSLFAQDQLDRAKAIIDHLSFL